MVQANRTPDAPIYQLRVTLRDIQPPVWRRLLVESEITLRRLHLILQATMGWWDYHLHQFIVGGVCYSMPYPELEIDCRDECRAKLARVAPAQGATFVYEYDFGDDWLHDIQVEKILPREASQVYPVCIAGERATPPEDVGGPCGYEDFLKAIRNPRHPEHDAYRVWSGGEFDPETCDLEMINLRLQLQRR